jgi:hypothetical protein
MPGRGRATAAATRVAVINIGRRPAARRKASTRASRVRLSATCRIRRPDGSSDAQRPITHSAGSLGSTRSASSARKASRSSGERSGTAVPAVRHQAAGRPTAQRSQRQSAARRARRRARPSSTGSSRSIAHGSRSVGAAAPRSPRTHVASSVSSSKTSPRNAGGREGRNQGMEREFRGGGCVAPWRSPRRWRGRAG